MDTAPPKSAPADRYLRAQLALMRLLRPWDVSGLEMIRLGRDRDGGYVVPLNAISAAEACLSFGVGLDTSFEDALVEVCAGIAANLFDHSIARPPMLKPRMTFTRHGVCGADTQWVRGGAARVSGYRIRGYGAFIRRNWPFFGWNHQVSLVTHLRRLGLVGRSVAIKIDIDGREYDVIAATPTDTWRDVVCLVVEFHALDSLRSIERAVDCLNHLARTHLLVHVHGNNYGPLVPGPHGLSYPEVVELTFVNRRLAAAATLSQRRFPSELDRPCRVDRPDLDLSFLSSPALASTAQTPIVSLAQTS